MNRSRLFCLFGIIVILSTGRIWAAPEDGDAKVHIGPVRWMKDSIDNFAVSDAGNVLLLGRQRDTVVIVTDPGTGEERSHLRGFIQSTSLGCSPDGEMCLMAGAVDPIDHVSATLLYRTSDGQLLWKKTEQARYMAMSTKLNRVLIKYRDSPKYELRDLTTGETLVQGSNVIEYAFMDEWHRRIYVSTGKWNGVIGNWTIELDAATGQELNAWGLETYGVMCRMKDSDTLLILGEDLQRPGFKQAKVIALNVLDGRRGPVVRCPAGVTDECDCILWNIQARLTLNAEGTRIMMHRVRSNIDESIIARRFTNGQSSGSECYLSDTVLFSGDPIPQVPEFVDDVNGNYYYVPNGARYGFICRTIDPVLSVPDPGASIPLTLVVDGSTLRISSPSGASGEGVLSITDVSGRLVKRSVIRYDGPSILVPIADLTSGTYLCSLEVGTTTTTGKFSLTR